jgi:putative membrane protein
VTCTCLAVSAAYELAEWLVAVVSGASATAFLGTQGDPFDTPAEMAPALLGAMTALALLNRPHVRLDERDVETEPTRPPRHVSTLPPKPSRTRGALRRRVCAGVPVAV